MKDKSKVLKTYGYYVRLIAVYRPNWGAGL